MEARRCPKCNTKWYSSDTKSDWRCMECGAVITDEHKVDLEEGQD